MYCIVSPFSKTFDDIGLTYFIPDFLNWELKIWNIVDIPIKEAIEIAVVLDIVNETNIDNSKIKSIIWIKNNNIFLYHYQQQILPWIAEYYFTAIHNSLNLFFPKNLKEKILKDKINKEFEKENKSIDYSYKHKATLSNEQNKLYKDIQQSSNNKILLYWVTGSGKTEVYIKLIEEALSTWKQSLFLIPEIILTNQIASRIKEVFWEEVIVINSTVSDAKKTKYWISIYNGNAKIIIGTRSALFYPFKDLWLIIIDEEHDNSYISDSHARYNTIEIAEKITEINNNKLILASGTPSIKSMYKWVKWEYRLLYLLNKY
jgi:primosomal protein N' (replication factor Y)